MLATRRFGARGVTFASAAVAATSAKCRHAFHTTPLARASILFALQALSNSRETQHFNKISRLDRVEHSPSLQLIKSSEVDPFPSLSGANVSLPATSNEADTASAFKSRLRAEPTHRSRPTAADQRAQAVGHAILSSHSRKLYRMQRNLQRLRQNTAQQERLHAEERRQWTHDRHRLQREIQSAGGLIVLAVGVATGLAVWRFGGGNVRATNQSLEQIIVPSGMTDSDLPSIVAPVAAMTPATNTHSVAGSQPVTTMDAATETAASLSWQDLLWKKT